MKPQAANERPDASFRYEWFVFGDINGFFGLMFDNLTYFPSWPVS